MYKNSHGEKQALNVFQATAQGAAPGGKTEVQAVGLRGPALSWVPLLGGGPSVGMPTLSTEGTAPQEKAGAPQQHVQGSAR